MCYSDFGESRDKWRIVFYRYPIKSGFKRRSRNAFIQGGYNEVQSTVTFPISFSNAALGVMATLSQGDQEAAQTWSYTARDLYLFQRYSGRWAHWIAVGF